MDKSRQLNSGWSPLIIFPHNNEVWLDADEKQLRAFAGLTRNNTLDIKMSITPLIPESPALDESLGKISQYGCVSLESGLLGIKGTLPGNSLILSNPFI